MSPQANGRICQLIHKTILNEFYQVTFRKKLCRSLEELQKTWTIGRNAIPMNELIKGRDPAAKRQ